MTWIFKIGWNLTIHPTNLYNPVLATTNSSSRLKKKTTMTRRRKKMMMKMRRKKKKMMRVRIFKATLPR